MQETASLTCERLKSRTYQVKLFMPPYLKLNQIDEIFSSKAHCSGSTILQELMCNKAPNYILFRCRETLHTA